jgi:AcrR family transcriptional regulator
VTELAAAVPESNADTRSPQGAHTKEKLLRAAERLFARDGIHRVRVREINALAGQKNSSALHYHFGSRERLVEAILLRHEEEIDLQVDLRLDALEAESTAAGVRDVVEAIVRPLAAKLETQQGRDFLRIVPQILELLSENLRRGRAMPATPTSQRILALLEDRMSSLPEPVRRERLVAYILMLTSILAERAHHIETGHPMLLDTDQFIAHVLDIVEASLTAPSSLQTLAGTARHEGRAPRALLQSRRSRVRRRGAK